MIPRASTLAAVVVLGLALAPPARAWSGTASAPALAEGVDRVERALLPRIAAPVTVRVHALAGVIVLEAPQATQALARGLRMSPIALCPDLDETAMGVVLHCRSRRIVARLSRSKGGTLLDVAETRGLPWEGEDGAPLVAFEPWEAGLGARCPGSTPAGRAECALAHGDRALAAAALAAAEGTSSDEAASLRRGDLAFAGGDVAGAAAWWGRTRGRPWEQLAAARLCELSWSCLATTSLDHVYRPHDLPAWAARDLELRRARTLAFLGRSGPATTALVASGAGDCEWAPGLCRDIAAAALADPGPASVDALALWVSIPEKARSPASYDAALAAAGVAEREGAPIFAANLLAAAAGQVPVRLLRAHLLRTAELFVAGGDLVRAGVVVEFAKTRGGDRALAGPRWAAVTRAIRSGGALSRGRDP